MEDAIKMLEDIMKKQETKKKIYECQLRSSKVNLLVKETVDKMCTDVSPIGRLELRNDVLKGLIELISIEKEISTLVDTL